MDPETGDRTLNSNVSHICARSENGPRWDENQTEADNRNFNNLLLLCLEHAWEVDQPNRMDVFTPPVLRDWKAQQLADFDALGRQGWALTDDMAESALHTSISVAAAAISLGGEGGRAPGAGGGGGGAIGANARGGNGGPGGKITLEGFADSAAAVPTLLDSGHTRLNDGQDGPAHGAGGGGAGTIGENAVGGDGGGGGDRVIARISEEEMEALRAEGFERIDFVIPEGGRAAKYPGEHAEDGGETVLNFVTANGRVLRTIRASGGRGAQSTCEIPAGSREITPADISAGFRVSAILPADVVYVRDGVCSLLGGGFTFSNVESIPVDISWILLLKLDFGASVDNMSLAMFVTVDDPYGREVLRLPVVAQREHEAEPGRVACVSLRFTARKSGPHAIRVLSGPFVLAQTSIEVRPSAA
ncbi:hypothetical protein [Pandoraea pnomenusa]|uniref:hypothetical protein n=1 Tax=Pandoraea pnomenusa TaxID=93220 RepID=UPI0011C0297B|nr:hypothetical protein [Pandoraea pnomenusa]